MTERVPMTVGPKDHLEERFWLIHGLLWYVCHAYDYAGHSLGRSLTAACVEAARDLMGPMSPECYEWIKAQDYSVLERAHRMHMDEGWPMVEAAHTNTDKSINETVNQMETRLRNEVLHGFYGWVHERIEAEAER